MSRPKKQTVDYFPHYCNHGKTMFILEQKYGNDGYAFWFKLLEMIGSAEGHCLHFKNGVDWEFLEAKTRLPKDTCKEIMELLSTVEAIDRDLWVSDSKVWISKFVENIKDAYRNRVVDIPIKPDNLRKKTHVNKDNLRKKTTDEMKRNEKKKEVKSISKKIPYNEILESYHKICVSLPKATIISKGRKNIIRLRYKKYGIDGLVELFKKTESSDFLSGRSEKWSNCSFDWILNENNMIKILEGNYKNKTKKQESPYEDL